MSLVFGHTHLDARNQELLERAYEFACDELQSKIGLNHAALAELLDPITSALLDFHAAGQRDEKKLARCAVLRGAVELLRRRGLSSV